MPCYHPLIGIDTGERTPDGKIKYWIRKREDSADFQFEIDHNEHIKIPCGHCIGCRLDYSRSWADRMMLELETAGCGVFLTLTYDNAHLPISDFQDVDLPEDYYLPFSPLERWCGNRLMMPIFDKVLVKGEEVDCPKSTLVKRDFQLFMKRLRREFDGSGDLPFKKIRFYAAGEYGSLTRRAHMHCILFGLNVSDFPDFRPHGKNELGQIFYSSDRLAHIWSNGFCLMSDVSWKTCAYVARYVTKKLNGDYALDYAVRNCIPEFSLMSRKPGIGRQYLDEHPDCLDFSYINLSTLEGGVKISIPKYYLKQLQLIDSDKYDRIMEQRKQFAEDSMLLKLQSTDLRYLEYLEVEEQKKLNCVRSLKRE